MAVSEDLIISIDSFRFYTNVEDTVDAELIEPAIILAQDSSEQILGTALKEKLVADFNAGTLTGVYSTIHTLLTKWICWTSYKKLLPKIYIRVSNGKLTKGSSIDSDTIESTELSELLRSCDGDIAVYENKLKAYLSDNESSITEFDSTVEWYYKENLEKVDTSQGLTSTPNRRYSDF